MIKYAIMSKSEHGTREQVETFEDQLRERLKNASVDIKNENRGKPWKES
jgi:hypothetical protein